MRRASVLHIYTRCIPETITFPTTELHGRVSEINIWVLPNHGYELRHISKKQASRRFSGISCGHCQIEDRRTIACPPAALLSSTKKGQTAFRPFRIWAGQHNSSHLLACLRRRRRCCCWRRAACEEKDETQKERNDAGTDSIPFDGRRA